MTEKKIEELLVEIDETVMLLYQNREQEAYQKTAELFGVIQQKYTQYVEWVNKEENSGQIAQYLVQTLQALIEAYQRKDILKLADTLRYDVRQTIVNFS